MNQIFFKNLNRNNKNTLIFVNEKNSYFLFLHFKLSTLFYSTQLMDIFAYEILTNLNLKWKKKSKTVTVYNFHSIYSQQRFFIFTLNCQNKYFKNSYFSNYNLFSITELFSNANWLEREVSELSNVFFFGKKDLRNLLLPYGDSTNPMLKTFPSIGTREICYNSLTDLLEQTPVSIQF